MKRFLALAAATLALVACTDTTGLSEKSSRGSKGNPSAAVTVVEFADLQCPACQSAHSQITTPLLEKYGTQIRFTFKHFPLRSLHRYALEAAMASECSADQGKFWEYVDQVYAEQKKLDLDQLSVWAKALGLDQDLFDRCMQTKIKRSTVLADYEEGQELGVTGTPTYFVNGKKVESGFDTLSAAIEEALGGVMQRL
ncbi:MAG: DSBA oxidoreductase [Candidatus Peregrinibacteria bacterium Greene0416_62]|nr:MAG: DSBA oxidoreductase [Candidatus Peregrinibacteria bacterium Greene0416_62]TSD00661.1 MAG: DSBA oxidoreductase [Candidatus Peregrinibacteria bacterium Greene1014_49]